MMGNSPSDLIEGRDQDIRDGARPAVQDEVGCGEAQGGLTRHSIFNFASVPVMRISLAPLVSTMARRPSSWVAPRPV